MPGKKKPKKITAPPSEGTAYRVTVPITGSASKVVWANSKKEAIEKAWDDDQAFEMDEWEVRQKIVEGNIFHGMCNEAEAQAE